MSRRLMVSALLIIAVCALGISGVFYLEMTASELREIHNNLQTRFIELEAETDTLLVQKQVYSAAFKELDDVKIISENNSNIDFYSEAQRAIQRGGSFIMSNSPSSVANGRETMGMSFAGDYYAVMRSLAEIRSLHNAIRIVSLNLTPVQPSGTVKIDVVLEAPVS